MPLDPKVLAEKVNQDFDFFSPPRDLESVLLQYGLEIAPELTDAQVAEQVLDRRGKNRYVAALIARERETRAKSYYAPFQVFPDAVQIVGFSHPRSEDSPLMAKVRRVEPILKSLVAAMRALTPYEFEHLCARLLRLLGADDSLRTKASGDGGIDFIGTLRLPETLLGTEERLLRAEFKMLALGQAKRYAEGTIIGVAEVRELLGAAAAFYHDQMAPWESNIQLPRNTLTLMPAIRPVLITTGPVTSGSRELADTCGVVLLDGPELARFLCLSDVAVDEIFVYDPPRLQFDAVQFRAWVSA